MDNQHPGSTHESPTTTDGLRWSQERRLKFIDYRLRWEGRINRNDIAEFFDISMPQATADLSRYSEVAPENIDYDRSSKAFVRTPDFKAKFDRSSSRMYLTDLLALVGGITESEASFVKWHPPVATLPVIGRQVEGGVLMTVLQAIREGRLLSVEYLSVARPAGSQRILSPHALAHDGFRWHLRAFCHSRKRFLDFVIARIRSAVLGSPSPVRTAEDQEWHTQVVLQVAANPALPEASRRTLELDYGMTDGLLAVKCRHSMLLYALLKFGLLHELTSPFAQQLVLVNREEVQPYLEMLLPELEDSPDASRLV